MGVPNEVIDALLEHLSFFELSGLRIVAQNIDPFIFTRFLQSLKRIILKEADDVKDENTNNLEAGLNSSKIIFHNFGENPANLQFHVTNENPKHRPGVKSDSATGGH